MHCDLVSPNNILCGGGVTLKLQDLSEVIQKYLPIGLYIHIAWKHAMPFCIKVMESNGIASIWADFTNTGYQRSTGGQRRLGTLSRTTDQVVESPGWWWELTLTVYMRTQCLESQQSKAAVNWVAVGEKLSRSGAMGNYTGQFSQYWSRYPNIDQYSMPNTGHNSQI